MTDYPKVGDRIVCTSRRVYSGRTYLKVWIVESINIGTEFPIRVRHESTTTLRRFTLNEVELFSSEWADKMKREEHAEKYL